MPSFEQLKPAKEVLSQNSSSASRLVFTTEHLGIRHLFLLLNLLPRKSLLREVRRYSALLFIICFCRSKQHGIHCLSLLSNFHLCCACTRLVTGSSLVLSVEIFPLRILNRSVNGALFFPSKRSGLFFLLIVTLSYSIVIFRVQHKLSSVSNILYVVSACNNCGIRVTQCHV